nr:hypothetical protein [uncultured bacterium]
MLAGTGPLLQRWFARTGHRDAGDPYFLYAASNLGSALALLGYPFLLEPRLRLAEQSLAWTAGYALLALLVAACGLGVRGRGAAPSAAVVAAADGPAAPVTTRERALWTALAFAPSSLLLSVTTYITTDVAAAPLFWVVPLALYLLTFTVAFARRPVLPHALMLRLQPVPVVAVAVITFLSLDYAATLVVHSTKSF